jgi:hypothetical protein
MSIATVHYLSMNVHSGQVTLPATPTHGVAGSFTFASLTPSLGHTVNWGDATANSTGTTDTNGSLTVSHTYSAAGTYTIVVTETVGGRVVASKAVTEA